MCLIYTHMACIGPIFMAMSTIAGLKLKWNSNTERRKNERIGKIRAKGKMAAAGKVYMQRLLAGAKFLLDVSVRFHDLFGLHGRKFLGNDL
ncbi:hypothetical protein SBDP2_90007 [Syntrophobacter sp. SbD2]|nr:hypothetical protein SBDP2_90007 [Syntrophobacter sp. SbD2]